MVFELLHDPDSSWCVNKLKKLGKAVLNMIIFNLPLSLYLQVLLGEDCDQLASIPSAYKCDNFFLHGYLLFAPLVGLFLGCCLLRGNDDDDDDCRIKFAGLALFAGVAVLALFALISAILAHVDRAYQFFDDLFGGDFSFMSDDPETVPHDDVTSLSNVLQVRGVVTVILTIFGLVATRAFEDRGPDQTGVEMNKTGQAAPC